MESWLTPSIFITSTAPRSRTISGFTCGESSIGQVPTGTALTMGFGKSGATPICEAIMQQGWNKDRGAFTQYFGGTALDASILTVPMSGFASPTDPRCCQPSSASRKNFCRTAWCIVTSWAAQWVTDFPDWRAPSASARSGWWKHCHEPAGSTKRDSFSRPC
jgi:hypothetical protein